MNAEQPTEGRRVLRRYSVADRERLIKEFEESDQTRGEFAKSRGISAGTFHGWFRAKRQPGGRRKKRVSGFTAVQIPSPNVAPVEVILPNGVRVGIRFQGSQEELVALIRGVVAC